MDAASRAAPAGLGRSRRSRRQGHGKRGLADLCRLLLEQTPTVTLFVRPENEAAIRLYESIGMRRVAFLPEPALLSHTVGVKTRDFRAAVEADIREHGLIEPGGEVTCLVSGGADSTCLWHVLRGLGYRVSALHVNHGLRGQESEEDAAFCRDVLGAEVVDGSGGKTEDEWREIRYSFATDRLRATGHTASDQVETVLYRIVASGAPGKIDWRRDDGVVRPLLNRWRDETEAYCLAEGLDFRRDTSNPDTKRGLIRDEILPLLRRLHPAAEGNLLRLADRKTAPPELIRLLESIDGSTRLDLGRGRQIVREYETRVARAVARGPRPGGPLGRVAHHLRRAGP